jgi:hypothetical protein
MILIRSSMSLVNPTDDESPEQCFKRKSKLFFLGLILITMFYNHVQQTPVHRRLLTC